MAAIVISQAFAAQPSVPVFAVCGGLAVLDVLFGLYLLRNVGAVPVVTPDDITFTRRQGRKHPPNKQVIERVDIVCELVAMF